MVDEIEQNRPANDLYSNTPYRMDLLLGPEAPHDFLHKFGKLFSFDGSVIFFPS